MPIPVWNGDTITIEATGQVCPSSVSDDCFGSAGADGDRWRGYNYDELRDAPHASLRSFRVRRTTSVRGGAYDVDVIVAPAQ